MPEAIWFKLRRHGWPFQHGVVAPLGFCRRYVADGLQDSSIVEPIDPFEGCELNGLKISPWPASVDHFGFVKAVDGFGESIVVGISDAADGSLDAGFSQTLGVLDGYVLAASVAMVDEPAAMDRSPIMQGLLQRIEHEEPAWAVRDARQPTILRA